MKRLEHESESVEPKRDETHDSSNDSSKIIRSTTELANYHFVESVSMNHVDKILQ